MPRTRIKICGVKDVAEARAAADAGADAIGMVLYAQGASRQVDANVAREVASTLPPFVMCVGVVRDCPQVRVRQLLAHVPLGMVQFHGKEPPPEVRAAQPTRASKILKTDGTLIEQAAALMAVRVPNLVAIHVDAPGGGGTGEAADWDEVERLDRANLPPLVVAGGLTPGNVGEVVRRLRPWAVDVSSGVEGEEGTKSPDLMAAFIAAVREADSA